MFILELMSTEGKVVKILINGSTNTLVLEETNKVKYSICTDLWNEIFFNQSLMCKSNCLKEF